MDLEHCVRAIDVSQAMMQSYVDGIDRYISEIARATATTKLTF